MVVRKREEGEQEEEEEQQERRGQKRVISTGGRQIVEDSQMGEQAGQGVGRKQNDWSRAELRGRGSRRKARAERIAAHRD